MDRDALAVIVAVAGPDSDGELRREADHPEVAVVLGGTGLASNRLVDRDPGERACGGAALHDALEDLRCGVGHARVDDLLARVLMLVDGSAVPVLDLRDCDRIAVDAAGSDRGVGLCHLQGRHARRSEGDRRNSGQVGIDTHLLGGGDDVVGTDDEGDLRVAGIGGELRRTGKRDDAVIVVAVVFDTPGRRGLQRARAVEDDRRVHALLDGCDEGECLERGAWLPEAVGRDIVLVRVIVSAADHGLDVAGRRIDSDHGGIEVGVADGAELVGDSLLCGILHSGVERRIDLEAALEDRVGIEVLGQDGLDVVRPVRIGAALIKHACALVERQRLCHRLVMLFLRDVACREHAVEDGVPALCRCFGVRERIVGGRRLREAGERRCLGKRQVGSILVEIRDRGSLDAVCAMAVVDGVEVHHEDLVLRVRLLHLDGDIGLADLALDRVVELLVGEHRVAHELLRDRGSALGAAAELHDDGADNALRVDAVMLVEADVLRVDRALEDIRGHLVDRDGAAVLHIELCYHVAIRVIDLRRLCCQVGVCRRIVRQVLEPRVHKRVHRHGERDRKHRYEAEDADDRERDGMGLGMLVSASGANAHEFPLS